MRQLINYCDSDIVLVLSREIQGNPKTTSRTGCTMPFNLRQLTALMSWRVLVNQINQGSDYNTRVRDGQK
jgi:hypothetical protein